MKTVFTRIFQYGILVLLMQSFIIVSGFSQSPATLMGIVTNCNTGNPIIGALVSVGTQSTYSVFGGIYSLSVNPPGTFTVTCQKIGYDLYTHNGVVLSPGSTVNLPICLNEAANPPSLPVASIDSTVSPPRVSVSWQVPKGDYELLYDDGIMDDFTVWALPGNMNAVKFTPLDYPVTVTGGKINIGTSSNYPSGSSPFVPFQISVYDASGSGGKPGVRIAGPVDVIPSNFGWVDFTIPFPPLINSGNFYLVMIQGGDAPNASGLAIDETYPQFRSYSNFVSSGSSFWVPAAGNFMIRATVNGPGGPPSSMDAPLSLTSYTLFRLTQGEEQNPAVWTLIGAGTATQLFDNAWYTLPCGPYRWAAQAIYTGNRVSASSFTNVLGKCWTVNTRVNVSLSCDSASKNGITVSLTNLVYPDTLYVKATDSSGKTVFPKFWKGSYQLKVSRFGYQDVNQIVSISSDTSFSVLLLQNKTAPTGLIVNDSSLIARWNKPVSSVTLFSENWQSGSFSTNGWTVQGPNWTISTAIGNPMPSAMFGWSPPVINYSQSLTSKTIAGQHSAVMRLQYDIYLNNFGTTTLNQMAVEIWDGSTWQQLKNYTNSNGDIPWTHQDLDISPYSGFNFKIRYRAHGVNSNDINNWNIDNIVVEARESKALTGQCLLGYNCYLNNVLYGYTPDTSYQIPPSLVQYGSTYTACVNAVYGSGPSAQTCFSFISGYLPPPENLQGAGIVDAANLSWDKPQSKMKGYSQNKINPPGLTGYIVFRDGLFLDSLKNADSLRYVDPGLYPGTYSYKVASTYDLTSYGHPGSFAQSYPAGPVSVNILYGLHLPFSEPWTQDNFTAHNWIFEPDAGNWSTNSTFGNPAPCAQFTSTPQRTSYSYSLISPVFDASSLTCANIWLDFDYRLLDNAANGNEKMHIEAFYNNTWHGIELYSDSGTTAWISRHLDISPVKSKAFRIRFRASGINSENIISWNIDNINIYGVCKPPEHLTADSSGNNIHLTWSSPVCEDGHGLKEGFEEATFPPPDWTQVITNVNNVTWEQTNTSSPAGVHSGLHAAGITYDYFHQDEWLIANDVLITGDLVFWSYAFQGSTYLDHYYVKISEDQGAHWVILLDMSALPPFPSPSGYNAWLVPYTLDLSSYLGQVLDIAWQAVDGNGQGLEYYWFIDDCFVGTKKIFLPSSPNSSQAYSVFRQDAGQGSYNQVNTTPVFDTTYLDQGLQPTLYRCYVTAYNPDCSLSTSSDTVLLNIITGTSSSSSPKFLNIFPNPAYDIVTIQSSDDIAELDVFNYLGQRILLNPIVHGKESHLNVSNLQQGVYFFRIKTGSTSRTFKVSIIRD
jgi:hypothetical protein